MIDRVATLRLALLALAALLCSAFLTNRIRQWARTHMLDVPNERSSHAVATPRGGGVAIFAPVALCALVYAVLADDGQWVLPYLVGSIVIALVSLRDDVRPLSAPVRLGVHALTAGAVVAAYLLFHGSSAVLDGGRTTVGVLAFVWVVGLTNAYNFMDGIDGIAGAHGAVAGVAWCAIGVLVASSAIAILGAVVAGAAAGFLRYNWPPARIFMGDVGSAFLGFTFAVLPLMGPAPGLLAIAGAMAMAPFIFDTSFTFLRRLLRRENVLQAHRSHLYQRLVRTGRSHRAVTNLYVAGSTISCILAVLYVESAVPPIILAAALLSLAVGLLIFVRAAEQTSGVRASGGTTV